jgi:transcriptional antiterminator RfaH
LSSSLRKVHHARGVTGVVHFGSQWPQISEASILQLQATVGSDELHVVHEELSAGEEVVISGGAFHDLHAVVTRVLPARARVAVLLSFLGRQTMVEVPAASVIREGSKERLLKSEQPE